MNRTLLLYGFILLGSLAVLYEQVTKRIPTRLQASQAPRSGYGLVPMVGGDQPVRAKGVDIIFVHGLGSNPDTTWRAKRTETNSASSVSVADQFICWVTDLLPDDLPPNGRNDTRIFWYNYDSYWKRDAVHTRLRNIGKRLLDHVKSTICRPEERNRQLIFVGYSYGGLVIKQALVQAFAGEEYNCMARRTKAILFLGTPHRGSSFSRLGWLVAQALRPLGSNPSLLTEVEYDSTYLLDLHESFSNVVSDNLQMVNFFEQRPTSIARLWFLRWQEFCVREQSATYSDSGRVTSIGLSVDHSGLNKFASRDENYMLVASTIASITRSMIQLAKRHYVVPLETVSTYTPRHELSKSLERHLEIARKNASVPHAVAVHGLGGTGKSQLVLDFAEAHRDRYDPILWIDATDVITTRNSFERFAAELNMDIYPIEAAESALADSRAVQAVLAWLHDRTETDDEWLVIIDNVDDVTWGIKKIIPRGKRGSIIITSRDQYSTMLIDGGCQKLEVSVMSKLESRRLLLRHLRWDMEFASGQIRRSCDVIAERLGYLPLALDLAGAYVSNEADQEAGLTQYTKDYVKQQDRLLQYDGFRGLRPTEKTVWTVWDTTLEKLERESAELQPNFLLAFFARFKATSIQDEMFRLASFGIDVVDQKLHNPEGLLPTTLRQFIRTTAEEWDDFLYRQSRNLLIRYSLVQRVDGEWPGITMHDLVKWKALQYEKSERWEWWYTVFMLAACQRLISDTHHPEFRRQLVKHIPDAYLNNLDIPDETHGYIQETLGRVYYDEGWWRTAEELLLQVVEVRKKKLGLDHPDTLTSMTNLASTYSLQARGEAAEGLLKQVIETSKEKLGLDHSVTLTGMGILAFEYIARGRSKAAEKLFVQMEEAAKKKPGFAYPDTMDSICIYEEQGRWDAAENLWRQEINTSKEKLGLDHPETLGKMIQLASMFWDQGRWDAAAQLLVQVMETYREKLGPEHPRTVRSMAKLAWAFWKQRQWEAAGDLFAQVVEANKKKFGLEHTLTVGSMSDLALTHFKQQRWEAAGELFAQVVEANIKMFGLEHPDTLKSRGVLVLTLFYFQGRWSEAEQLRTQMEEAFKSGQGGPSKYTDQHGHPRIDLEVIWLDDEARNPMEERRTASTSSPWHQPS